MKKIFCISDYENAYFYEVEDKGIENLIADISDKFRYEESSLVVCKFYNKRIHDYGKYQEDVVKGRARINNVQIIEKNKKKKLNDFDNYDNVKYGKIRLDLAYYSQISKIINNTFNFNPSLEKYEIIDFTKLIEICNYINKRNNSFMYDEFIDKINAENQYDKQILVNKDIWLNEKERQISSKEFKDIINSISKYLDFNYIGNCNINSCDNRYIEILKRFAIRNSNMLNYNEFEPIINKLFNDKQSNINMKDISFVRYFFNNDLDGPKTLKKI